MKCFSCMGRGCPVCVYTGKFVNHRYIESNERYTPVEIIEAARRCMGCIDFDPASSKKANEVVKATRFYDYIQDGLKQEWYGNGWCNPPFGLVPGDDKGLQGLFIEKAIDSFENGYVEQMIMLLNGQSPYNLYFYHMWKYPVCFYQGRVNFRDSVGNIHRGLGSVIVYMGGNYKAFEREFLQFGPITSVVVTGYQKYYYTNRLDKSLKI